MRSVKELCPEAMPLIIDDSLPQKNLKVNIMAMGDVGGSLLMGLKLLGGDLIDTIGIFDIDENVTARYDMEMNQIGWPFGRKKLPKVKILSADNLFDCHMLVFCASRGVPPLSVSGDVDVRMAQFEANREIAAEYGRLAGAAGFKGIFAVVSDPVDPLCREVLTASGLKPGQVRGYGLGVINKRAEYFASQDKRFESYLTEGRAYGPHGEDLVIANSVTNYDNQLSLELTKLTRTANLQVRQLGFKPYMAPAISSGAISLILTLQGEWNYSSIYFGMNGEGAFLGIKNRLKGDTVEFEDFPMPEELYERIRKAYRNLCLLK